VSVLPVRNSEFASARSSKITTLLAAVAPNSVSPARIASIDAAGMVLRKASTPRRNVRCSCTFAAVASVGIPSKNSRVPSRVETRSGVMIFAGIGVLKCGVFCAITCSKGLVVGLAEAVCGTAPAVGLTQVW
jgi:hypothetical protein